MSDKKTFEIGNQVVLMTELGTYSTVRTITSIHANLATCKWTDKYNKTHTGEYLFKDLKLATPQFDEYEG